MNTRFIYLLLLLISVTAHGQKVYNSYKGLVMTGYQGWFTTPYDGSGRGFHHYQGKDGFRPGSCSVDFWPDVSEYEKTYSTDFKMKDGSPAHVFSSYDESTVNTHFRWMKEYGIDGAFMQRFVTEIRTPIGKRHFNKVLESAMKSANQYERAICIMYDLSGMKSGEENLILTDIDELSRIYSLKDHDKNPSYLYHNGKPLVTVWGVGFNDKRQYGLKEARTIINGLKKRGFSVMIGTPTHWRTRTSDTVNDIRLHKLIKDCDIVMPWFVGRYNEDQYPLFNELIKEDIRWCRENGIDYVPLVYPGFSWHNMKGEGSLFIPRNRGSFLWKQLTGAIQAGAEMIYVAMFDEIDEGTAIFKCAKEVPVGEGFRFVPIESDLESDYYLQLVGKAGKILKEKRELSEKLPK